MNCSYRKFAASIFLAGYKSGKEMVIGITSECIKCIPQR